MRPEPSKKTSPVVIGRGMRIGPADAGARPARDPYKLERRGDERVACEERTSMVASYSDGVSRSGIAHLELVDRSVSGGGMGVRSRVKIDPGMIVTICPEGSAVPWVSARAARCERESGGWWRVGLRMSALVAA